MAFFGFKHLTSFIYLSARVCPRAYEHAISQYVSVRHEVVIFAMNNRVGINSRSADNEDIIWHECVDGLLLQWVPSQKKSGRTGHNGYSGPKRTGLA
jgi:hypothetical protein